MLFIKTSLNLNYTDKGFEPLDGDHESTMLPVTSIRISPVQVSHLLLPITKRLHYFYANRALCQLIIIFIYYDNCLNNFYIILIIKVKCKYNIILTLQIV